MCCCLLAALALTIGLLLGGDSVGRRRGGSSLHGVFSHMVSILLSESCSSEESSTFFVQLRLNGSPPA